MTIKAIIYEVKRAVTSQQYKNCTAAPERARTALEHLTTLGRPGSYVHRLMRIERLGAAVLVEETAKRELKESVLARGQPERVVVERVAQVQCTLPAGRKVKV